MKKLEFTNSVPVSVVIPYFKSASTVIRAITSVASQTRPPVEVVLVDDASGGEDFGILHNIELEYKGWIKVFVLEKNQGAASARNAGWSTATQPYIAFLDADDSWHPDKLRIQYQYMSANPDVVISGHQCSLHGANPCLAKIDDDYSVTTISGRSLLMKNAFSTPTVMLKRDIAFRFEEGKRCAEDLLLWQQIAFAGLRVVRLESPLAYVHKPLFGVGGLSANLWKMEKGELSNFVSLYRSAQIGLFSCLGAIMFSLLKFARRIVISRFRTFGNNVTEERGD